MRNALRNIWFRLKAQQGETLAETLAAILISAVAITAMTTGIATATRLNSDAHNHENAIRVSMQAAEEAAGDDALSGTLSVTVTSDAGSNNSSEGKTLLVTVTVYGQANGADGSSEVVSYLPTED